MRPNVLLVEDDLHFAQWASGVLRSAGDLRVHVTHGLNEGLQAWQLHRADWQLAVVDLHLGTLRGVDLIQQIAQDRADLPILVITSVESPAEALEAIRAGAQGYILKSTIDHELLNVVRQVMAGGSPITPSIARQLLTEFRGHGQAVAPSASAVPGAMMEKLSQREVEVLRLLARGYTDKEVAAQLEIAPTTVDTHVRKIYRKLSINSRVELRRLLG
ncbi:response regulator transcription factor [Sphaerotilus hippei]|uniref:response regulator transcription factor n=1 Tax=Sphaerotilus hippei TaxID=744406 RepID=UPI001474C327|nr:response regulator transcription factor [Sphaerotilus hippei]